MEKIEINSSMTKENLSNSQLDHAGKIKNIEYIQSSKCDQIKISIVSNDKQNERNAIRM